MDKEEITTTMTTETPSLFFNFIKEKFNSKFYGVFIISWAIIHWDFLYTLFFVNQNEVGTYFDMLKIEYVKYTYFNCHDLIVGFIESFSLTILAIFIIPRFIIEKFVNEEEIRQIEAKATYIDKKQNVTEKVKEKLKKLNETNKEIEKENTDSNKYYNGYEMTIEDEEDFHKFRKSLYYKSFKDVKDSILRQNGSIKFVKEGGDQSRSEFLDVNTLGYYKSIGLITQKNGSTISFTSKGDYYMKLDYDLSSLPNEWGKTRSV